MVMTVPTFALLKQGDLNKLFVISQKLHGYSSSSEITLTSSVVTILLHFKTSVGGHQCKVPYYEY